MERKRIVLLVSVEFPRVVEEDLGALVKDYLESEGLLQVHSVHADELNKTRDLTMDLPRLSSTRKAPPPPPPKKSDPATGDIDSGDIVK